MRIATRHKKQIKDGDTRILYEMLKRDYHDEDHAPIKDENIGKIISFEKYIDEFDDVLSKAQTFCEINGRIGGKHKCYRCGMSYHDMERADLCCRRLIINDCERGINKYNE